MSAARHGLFRQRSTSVHLIMHIRHPKLPRLSSPTYKARMRNAMVIHLEFILASYQNLNLIIKSNVCLFPVIRKMSGFEATNYGAYRPLQMLRVTSKPCLCHWNRRGFIIKCVCKKDFMTAIERILNCLERADEIRLRYNGMLPGYRRLKWLVGFPITACCTGILWIPIGLNSKGGATKGIGHVLSIPCVNCTVTAYIHDGDDLAPGSTERGRLALRSSSLSVIS